METENKHASMAREKASKRVSKNNDERNREHLKVQPNAQLDSSLLQPQTQPHSPIHEMASPLPKKSGVSAFYPSADNNVDGKPFEIESKLTFQPPGAWQTILANKNNSNNNNDNHIKRNNNNNSNNNNNDGSSSSSSRNNNKRNNIYNSDSKNNNDNIDDTNSHNNPQIDAFHISTSFLTPGFIVSCPVGADRIKIDCAGVLSFKVLYTRDEENSSSSGVVLSEINVPSPENGQRQRVEVKTPWPCMKIEAVVNEKADVFVTLFDVCVYSTLRPSSQSTPMGKMNRGDKVW